MDIQSLFAHAVVLYQQDHKGNVYQLYLNDNEFIEGPNRIGQAMSVKLMDYERGKGAGFFIPLSYFTTHQDQKIKELYEKVLLEMM